MIAYRGTLLVKTTISIDDQVTARTRGHWNSEEILNYHTKPSPFSLLSSISTCRNLELNKTIKHLQGWGSMKSNDWFFSMTRKHKTYMNPVIINFKLLPHPSLVNLVHRNNHETAASWTPTLTILLRIWSTTELLRKNNLSKKSYPLCYFCTWRNDF